MGKLVNHTVANLVGGVSQQFDEGIFEVQVRDMENCMPSISRGVLRRNPVANGTLIDASFTSSDYFVYAYDRGNANEQYLFVIGNGTWAVLNSTTKALVTSGVDAYLNIPTGVSPKDAFSLVTIGDFTFISNKYTTVSLSSVIDGTLDSHKTTGIYYIKRTTNVVISTTGYSDIFGNSTSTSYQVGYTYSLNGYSVTATSSANTLRGENIAQNIALNKGYSYNGVFVYKKNMNITDAWEWGDGAGNEASQGFKGVVGRSDMLPDKMPIELKDTVVQISQGTADSLDDFYLRYTGDTWVEAVKPGLKNTLSASTMPHVFIRGSDGVFYFKEYTETALATVPDAPLLGWGKRTAGDEESSPPPSFVGNQIKQILFHKNRLVFLTDSNIILSENGNYGNFFPTSVRLLLDTDPIDLAIASTDISVLHSAVSMTNAMLIFSDDSQFVLTATNGPLTATSATIDVVSRYNNSPLCSPKSIGNKVYFISESGGYSQVFLYNLTEGYAVTEANNVSQHIPSYLPKNIRYITGHSVLGYTFMWSEETPKTIYVYNNSIVGGQIAQSAFHRWTFAYDVIGINIINNNLVVTFRDSLTNHFFIGDISLELAGNIDTVNYTDKYNGVLTPYDSRIKFSKWFIKDSNNNGNKVGRLQIRTIQYTVSRASKFTTYIVSDDGYISTDIGTWDDTTVWDDTTTWTDSVTYYTVTVDNNDKVQVIGNSANTDITFSNDRTDTGKGFELSTINYEGFLHMRSQRY